MKSFISDAKFILLVLVIISVVTGVTNLENEADLRPSISKEIFNLDSAKVSIVKPSVSRGIASIEEPKEEKIASVLEESFFCNHSLDEKLKPTKIAAGLVMLNFKLCKDHKNIGSVTLYNETNGFKAQIFKSQNTNYKTDYIQLNNGENKIVIEVVLKDGQKNTDSLVILTGS